MSPAGEPVRVQAIAQTRNSVVPPQYVQPPETRPAAKLTHHHKNEAAELSPPSINVAGEDTGRLKDEIGLACRDWGAFSVVNHGVPIELLDQMRRVGKSFFEECDMEQKLKYSCDPNSPASEGYGSRMLLADNDSVLDWRDYFDHHTLPLSRRNPAKWPHYQPNYREVVAEYSDQMKVLAQRLLGLISESLGLPSSCIEEAVGEFCQNITVGYYPPCPQPDLTLGLQSHSDMGAVTLLIQDNVEGLQVFKDGEWITVRPLHDGILVLLADQTEIITNGKYRSCQHRALTNAERARLSVATFHDPAKTRKVFPAFEPPIYHEVMYGDYVSSWYTKGPEGKRNIDALLIKY
ncbi:probable 2-oxoglutarate-dependent dioxygenase At3g111800 [Coffea eugenioides]|uniref:probable 2-oxoglutarate-dependent dioxygenase At3g111800 n=1 Tax=Coffea eugenioides TaxID=49369 RepID=UPI000F6143CA|nr:probable 2-oxoglutarate-dependent dioxygenase At3g111800 [Coffea eugenioides]